MSTTTKKLRGYKIDFATETIIVRSHLAMIETGTKQPNFETIWALANAFDLQPHELVLLFEEEVRHLQKEIDKK